MPTRNTLPPCPDPERYTLVKTRDGQFWRLKSSIKKPGILNHGPHHTGLARSTGTAGSSIFNKMITLLRGGPKSNGRVDLSVLRGLDLQNDYPLRKLLRSGFQWRHDTEKHIFSFRIQIPEYHGALLRQNKQMSAYRFIIILVQGNPEEEKALQLKSIVSQDYSFAGTGVAGECLLELPYTPASGQWLCCLRAECLEEGSVATNVKSGALQVLDGGRWE